MEAISIPPIFATSKDNSGMRMTHGYVSNLKNERKQKEESMRDQISLNHYIPTVCR